MDMNDTSNTKIGWKLSMKSYNKIVGKTSALFSGPVLERWKNKSIEQRREMPGLNYQINRLAKKSIVFHRTRTCLNVVNIKQTSHGLDWPRPKYIHCKAWKWSPSLWLQRLVAAHEQEQAARHQIHEILGSLWLIFIKYKTFFKSAHKKAPEVNWKSCLNCSLEMT